MANSQREVSAFVPFASPGRSCRPSSSRLWSWEYVVVSAAVLFLLANVSIIARRRVLRPRIAEPL